MSIVLGSQGVRVVTPEETRLFDRWTLPLMILDREQRYVYANSAYLTATHSTLDGLLGRKVFDCFPDTPERVAAVETLFRATLERGEITRLEAQPFQLELEDGSITDAYWQAVQDPIFDRDGEVIGLIQRAEDITQQVELQTRNEAIGYELNHRVKNIMAVVSSIARITGRNATSVPDFVKSFTARLGAMSRTNDSLARGDWRGLTVREVLDSELSPYTEDQGRAYTLGGPDVRLSLDATKDLSMVAHELATNAAKYGCLGQESGALDIDWTYDGEQLVIRWVEDCGREIAAADPEDGRASGFGTRLFDMLPYVEVDRVFRPNGLTLTITISGRDAFA